MLSRRALSRNVQWTGRDSAIYNLGIGFGQAATEDKRLLPFALEEAARAFPTMVTILGGTALAPLSEDNIDLAGILHGEEDVSLEAPLEGQGELAMCAQVDKIRDKGRAKGAVMQTSREFRTLDGALVASVRSTLLLRRSVSVR